MKKLSWLFLFFIVSCGSKQYQQDMLPDGKTWMVKANEVSCGEDQKICKANIKKEIGGRGKLICGATPFRVISCEIKSRNLSFVAAHCLIRCGEKPVKSQKPANEKDVDFDPAD